MERMETLTHIGFTGHRDRLADLADLAALAAEFPGATWVHGGARGFDTQVADFAQLHGIEQVVIRPDYGRYSGKAAPIVRNKEIVTRCHLLAACFDGRSTGGTSFTVKYAQEQGKPVRILTPG